MRSNCLHSIIDFCAMDGTAVLEISGYGLSSFIWASLCDPKYS